MTAKRGEVAASLAERGRPENWATEAEAAHLSGFGPERFRAVVPELEKAGFPKINLWNGKRFIPAINAFWAVQVDSAAGRVPESGAEERDGESVENFDGKHGQRRAS